MQHTLDSNDPLLALETKRILLKETLHAYVLDFIYNHPIYRHLNFYGGICLYVVYGLNRLSEDIDLDNKAGVDLINLSEDLAGLFRKSLAYDQVEVKLQQSESRILRATIRLPV